MKQVRTNIILKKISTTQFEDFQTLSCLLFLLFNDNKSFNNFIYFQIQGFAISAEATSVQNSDWMYTEAEYKCDNEESNFYVPEISYEKKFKISCEIEKIFGKKFPYWKVPGTDYPKRKEIFCALPTKCYNFIDIEPLMSPLGLSDNFDNFNFDMEDKFQYFCSMDGDRGNMGDVTYI